MPHATKEQRNAYNRDYWKIPENRAKKVAYTRSYREKNRALVNTWGRLAGRRRRERGDKYSLRWYHQNKDQAAANRKAWVAKSRDKIRLYEQKRNQQPHWKARLGACRRINDAIRSRNLRKSAKSIKLLGCTALVLQQWLESQFQEGMSWDNYGYWGWHIDHVRPCASFDLSIPQQQVECFHYTNLQPLWRKDNLLKRDKYHL